MKLMITTAALAMIAVSSPAAAQYRAGAPNNVMSNPAAPPPGKMLDADEKAKRQTAAPAQEQAQVKPSKQALKALVELQNAVKNNDTANIPAKIAAAQAVAQTNEDRYLIAVFQRQAAIAANDNAALASAVEVLANSGILDSTKVGALYRDLGVKQFNAKQYPLAVAAFQRAASLAPNDAETLELLAQGMAAAGQGANAAGVFQKAIQARLASGEKPSENIYRRGVSAAYEARSPASVELARQWVAAYPSKDSWRNSIAIFRNLKQPDVEGTLDLLRLMQATGSLQTASEYALFATSAADQSNFNEAQAAVDAGIAAKVIDPSSPQFRDIVNGLKSKPKASAADLEAAAKSSPSAINLLRIGDRFYGSGNYARAAEIYRQVLSKSDADKDLANLHLGMALARAGDKAGAASAFNAVSGARADIAKYWLLYVQQHA
jgi:Flp pilus assembly protein TadD